MSENDLHVDRLLQDPLSALPARLLERVSPDSPRIGKAEREGSATYVSISEPHTMDECPFEDRRSEKKCEQCGKLILIEGRIYGINPQAVCRCPKSPSLESLKSYDFGLSDEEDAAFSIGVREGYRVAMRKMEKVEAERDLLKEELRQVVERNTGGSHSIEWDGP